MTRIELPFLPAVLLLGLGLCVPGAASGGDRPPAAEIGPDYRHPVVSPYPGAVLRWRDTGSVNQVAFDEYRRVVGYDAEAREPVTESHEGRVTRLVYDNPEGRSVHEIIDSFRSALQARGAQFDWSCASRRECGSHRGWRGLNGFDNSVLSEQQYFTGVLAHDDAEIYFSIGANRHRHTLHLVEIDAMQAGMVTVDADALGSALAREGRVELQGIHFDTGLATLRDESLPALEQVAALMQGREEIELHIVGHTDGSGDPLANRELSQARAEAVRQALTDRYRIPATRLSVEGVGSTRPVASNDTAEGRARNRRVELVVP